MIAHLHSLPLPHTTTPMSADAFSHVTTWVFDLDHTLYPPEARLFDLIEVRMTKWVMAAVGVDRAEADRLRMHYWQTHRTTLAGLMREHDVDPEPYLVDVHDISMGTLTPDPVLATRIPRATWQADRLYQWLRPLRRACAGRTRPVGPV